MSDLPHSDAASPPDSPTEVLLRSLRRKEGTWVEWGQACQQLQKLGQSPQAIFEATGFEPVHQNQVIAAAQVYQNLVSGNAPAAVLEHFQQRGSDILYELRILTQAERVGGATLIWQHQLDVEAAHEVARAIKDFSRLPRLPEGFTTEPGDAVAYQCWKFARQKEDLQERSRLIARGLRFAQSETARRQIEKLLTDFTVVKARPAPRLPLYRLESAEELPRILPVAGRLPLAPADLRAVPLVEESGPFRLVQHVGSCAWVPVPGWQVILNAEDPVGLLASSDQVGLEVAGNPEELLVVVDRSQRQWDENSYFLVEQAEELEIQWWPDPPELPLLGRVLLILRPRKILDQEFTKDPWQVDE